MKTTKLNPIAALISCLIISASSASAAVIIPLTFNGTTYDTTSGFAVNSTTDSVLNDVAWSDLATGTSGVVDISFSVATTSNTPGRSLTGGIGNNNGLLTGNQGTVTINNLALTSVSGDSFILDGFTNLTFAVTAGTGLYRITAPTLGGNINVPSSGSYDTGGLVTSFYFDANTASTLSFTGASIQLTGVSVPEPSCALLGGLGVLLLLRRRR